MLRWRQLEIVRRTDNLARLFQRVLDLARREQGRGGSILSAVSHLIGTMTANTNHVVVVVVRMDKPEFVEIHACRVVRTDGSNTY